MTPPPLPSPAEIARIRAETGAITVEYEYTRHGTYRIKYTWADGKPEKKRMVAE